MGTWISHLRIAENLLTAFPNLDATAFAYGSLAPDSGLPNADWTEFDPPKEVTHFLHKGEGEHAIRDYLFYRDYLAPLNAEAEPTVYGFRLGYFFHLLCDSLWSRKLVATTNQAFAQEIQQDKGQAWNNIKRDWYGLDQVYVQAHPACLFWRVIAATPNFPSQLPFISNVALHQQYDYIRNFYSHPEPAWLAPRRYPYLNEATMARMVADSTALLQQIWDQRQRFDEVAAVTGTTLALVPAEQLRPYSMPLGDEGDEH